MKQLKILLAAAITLMIAISSSGEPLGKAGRVYKCRDDVFNVLQKREGRGSIYDAKIAGQEMVNGKLMTRVDIDNPDYPHKRYFYREGKKIYEYLKKEKTTILIIDYDAKVGDRNFSDLNYNGSFFITHIDSISVGGKSYRRLFYGTYISVRNGAIPWVEGIGPLSTYLLESTKDSIFIPSWQPHVSSVYENDKCIFTFQDFLLSPLPWEGGNAGVEGIDADKADDDSRMFDLMGREIRNPLPGTIYIQGGKKFIAR